MRALSVFVLATAVVAPASGKPVGRAPRAPVPLEEYYKIRRIASRNGILLSFSADEKLVAYLSDEGGRPDVWVQPVAGGPAKQLTHVKGFVQALQFSPTADRLIYAADEQGDELSRLFITDSEGAPPKDLLPDLPAGRRADLIRWADDGKTFVYLSSQRDEKYLDLYEYELATGKHVRLWEASGKLELSAVSRDHTRFIIAETLSDANTNLYLVERATPTRQILLTPHQGDVLYSPHELSRDAKTLYYQSDEGREFGGLYAMDLATHRTRIVAQPDWDVEASGFSHGWKYFYRVTNIDGQSQLEVEEAGTRKQVALPAPPPGGTWVPLASSRTDRYLGVRLQGDAQPPTPYILDLRTGTAHEVIDPLPATLKNRKMAVGELVHVPSFDGKRVPAFLYKPAGAGPFPAVIDVHGGPTSQSRREFSGIRQYLVSKGYLVLVPNVRGSTGYGKTWMRLDNLDLGGGPLKDVVACKSWLVKEAHAQSDKIVVMGGSYGGYMALAAATFVPTEFAALVDFFGVSDLKSLVESFPPYWAASAQYIYQKFGDPKNPAHAQYQHDRSPLNFVDRIVRPLLVVQGDHDARVRKDQSDRIVDVLRKRSVPVHYLVLTGEGHGFSRRESTVAAFAATDRFLDRYLFGDNTVEVLPEPPRPARR